MLTECRQHSHDILDAIPLNARRFCLSRRVNGSRCRGAYDYVIMSPLIMAAEIRLATLSEHDAHIIAFSRHATPRTIIIIHAIIIPLLLFRRRACRDGHATLLYHILPRCHDATPTPFATPSCPPVATMPLEATCRADMLPPRHIISRHYYFHLSIVHYAGYLPRHLRRRHDTTP